MRNDERKSLRFSITVAMSIMIEIMMAPMIMILKEHESNLKTLVIWEAIRPQIEQLKLGRDLPDEYTGYKKDIFERKSYGHDCQIGFS